MIHIRRNKRTKQFRVVYTAKNGEILSSSETLKSKASAWKNIRVNFEVNHHGEGMMQDLFVQDDSGKLPLMYWMNGKYKGIADDIEPVNLTL